LCFGLPQGAVSLVLDSLDDIHCLQEAPLNDRDFLHSVLEDRQLHALLEVSNYFSPSTGILCWLYEVVSIISGTGAAACTEIVVA
jgi:hypothetical protein